MYFHVRCCCYNAAVTVHTGRERDKGRQRGKDKEKDGVREKWREDGERQGRMDDGEMEWFEGGAEEWRSLFSL